MVRKTINVLSSEALGAVMKQSVLGSMSTDGLWMLREKVAATLAAKIAAEKEVLEHRLRLLKRVRVEPTVKTAERRRYPVVFPKFRNPDEPSETWAGRGKRPRWLIAQLGSGKQLDDFLIERAAA
jgi:DNA-binding protein H-NS